MADTIIRDRDMRVVRRTRNLRAILEHSRDHAVERLDVYPGPHGTGQLGVAWADGSTTIVDFASINVLREWIARRRCFKHASVHNHDKPGIPPHGCGHMQGRGAA